MTLLTSPAVALLLRTTLLLGLALLAVRLLRGPAVQTLAGRAALAAVALLLLTAPLTKFVPPLWHVPAPAAPPPAAPVVTLAPTAPPPHVWGAGIGTKKGAGAGSAPTGLPHRPSLNPSFRKDGVKQGGRSPAPPELGAGGPLLLLWLAGTAALLLWLAICQWQLTRLHRRAVLLTDGPAFDTLAALTTHAPRLYACPGLPGPFLAGFLRPAIYLPADYAETFSPDALRAVLAHELAHAERHDTRWTLASRLLCALLWPQPLLWLLCRRLEQLSEDACDRAVLARACPPRVYADCLLSLAERRPLARSQRALGPGMVPFRSRLGQRIAQILTGADRPLPPPTRLFRVGVLSCSLVGFLGVILLLSVGAKIDVPLRSAGAEVDVPHFVWAKKQGWAVRPVRVLDLEHLSQSRLSALPYGITAADMAAMKQLNPSGVVSLGALPSNLTKARAEAVLAARPHFFYAEALLSQWYGQHGDKTRAAAFWLKALHDAPVVLARRYAYDDGTPVAGLHLGTSINCYSPSHLSASNVSFRNLGVGLAYDVVTDKDGCFYLPVFRAIYSQQGVFWQPDQLNHLTAPHLKAHADVETPGPFISGVSSDEKNEHLSKGFIAESRVAVLPQTQVRPRISLSAPFNGATGTERKPLPVKGSGLTIRWQPYPKADHYQVNVDEYHILPNGARWSQISATSNNPSRLMLPITQTTASLDFNGSDPVFSRSLPYSFMVLALDKNGEILSTSDNYFFQPVNALAPQTLTKAALAQVLGPGFQVTSIQVQPKSVTVDAISPAGFRLTYEASQALDYSGRSFGLGFAGWSSKPGLSMGESNVPNAIHFVYSRE